MRTIKFKAIEAKTGQWVYGGITSPLHSPNGNIQIVSCEYHEQHEDDEYFIFIDVLPETVCQFTGVFDSENNEIYEGDTCMLTASDDFSDTRYSNMCGVRTVYYRVNAGQFQFEDYVPLNWGGWKYVKILHNIHDYAGKP